MRRSSSCAASSLADMPPGGAVSVIMMSELGAVYERMRVLSSGMVHLYDRCAMCHVKDDEKCVLVLQCSRF